MNDMEYGAKLIYTTLEWPEYMIEHRKRMLRIETWIKILEAVFLQPGGKGVHIVISFTDEVRQVDFDKFSYSVNFAISLAREQHIEFMSYEILPTRTVFRSAMDELKYRIHSKWHKFWNTERVKRG